MDRKFKIYLGFCVFLFLFLLIIILFYSLGYKYNFNDNTTIQTGAIIIKTEPREVNIYKNNKLYKNNKTITNLFNDFVKIEELQNDIYNIKIEKPNYYQWEKNIKVRGGYVTELKNIVLLKKNYKKNILFDTNNSAYVFSDFWINNQKDKIAYVKTNKINSILAIFDINKNEENIIANLTKTLFKNFKDNHELNNVIWSNDNSKIVLKINSKNSSFWYLIDLENNNTIYKLNNIIEENKKTRNEINFYLDKLLYIKDNNLYELDYKNDISKKIFEDINNFSIYNNYIYYIKSSDNSLYYSKLNLLSKNYKITKLPEKFNPLFPAKIIKSSKGSFIILSSTGDLYFINDKKDIILISSFVKNAFFSNNDQRILYNNNHEIWTYYIQEKTSQPRKKEFTNELITRFSGNINSLFIYKDEEHIFYKENDILKFIEIDNRDVKNVFEIIKTKNDSIFYSKNLNSIFYIKDNKFIQINLNEK